MQGSLHIWHQAGLEFVSQLALQMTEESAPTQNQSPRLIIAAIVISVSSLLCCGCLALSWTLGDVTLQIIEQFSISIQNLPV